MKNYLKIVSLICVIGIFAAFAMGSISKYKGSVTINGQTMSTKVFMKEYNNNKVSFQNKYEGADIHVVDKILKINYVGVYNGRQMSEHIVTENGFTVCCDVTRFSVGDVVTIDGQFAILNNTALSEFIINNSKIS